MDRGKRASLWRTRCLLTGLACLCLAAGTASGNVLFSDSFDDGNINGWGTGAATRTISVVNGVVEIPLGGSSFYTVRPEAEGAQVFFAAGGSTGFSISADIQAQDSIDTANNASGNFGMYLTFTTAASTNNRYDFKLHTGSGGENDNIRIQEVIAGGAVTSLAVISEADAVFGNAAMNNSMNRYELKLTLGQEANQLQLFINDKLMLTALGTALVPESVSVAIHGSNNNDIRFDNVVLNAPEPAMMSLVGLAGVGLLVRRKRLNNA